MGAVSFVHSPTNNLGEEQAIAERKTAARADGILNVWAGYPSKVSKCSELAAARPMTNYAISPSSS